MLAIKNLLAIQAFVKTLKQSRLKSTGAEVVYFSEDLYNVDGSSNDPKKIPGHTGESWKALLISYGINANCYVTNVGAEGSHPNFSVGGHMTTSSDGKVADGGICYLMPLCYWHNNKARDGVRFTHTATKMLKLSGYNLGELGVTFQLRLPSEAPFAVLYYDENEWKFKNISKEEANNLSKNVFETLSPSKKTPHYVLIERKKDATILERSNKSVSANVFYDVVTSNLP